jgi:hypothetical protein
MTPEEIEQWLDNTSREQLLKILSEYRTLKQHLCSQVLLIPTGAEDWIDRAIRRATTLRNCENQLTKVIHRGEELLAEARWEIRETVCTNCMGSGVIQGNSCVICRGTGARKF